MKTYDQNHGKLSPYSIDEGGPNGIYVIPDDENY